MLSMIQCRQAEILRHRNIHIPKIHKHTSLPYLFISWCRMFVSKQLTSPVFIIFFIGMNVPIAWKFNSPMKTSSYSSWELSVSFLSSFSKFSHSLFGFMVESQAFPIPGPMAALYSGGLWSPHSLVRVILSQWNKVSPCTPWLIHVPWSVPSQLRSFHVNGVLITPVHELWKRGLLW